MTSTSKRKRGRPRLGYTTDIELRASPALAELIDATAKAAGVSRSEWMRRAALFYLSAGAPATVAQLADDDPDDDVEEMV